MAKSWKLKIQKKIHMATIIKEITKDRNGDIIEGFVEERHFENNLIIYSVFKTLTGEIFSEIRYTYENQNLIKKEETNNGIITNSLSIEYNSNARSIKEVTTNENQEITNKKELDENINVLTETSYGPEGEIQFITKTEYNKNNLISKQIEENDYITHYYYEDGTLCEIQITENGDITLKENYFYDSNNCEIKSEGYDYNEKEKIFIIKEYSNEAKILKQSEWTNEELSHETSYEYNEKGMVVRIDNKNFFTGEVHSKTFEYER